MAVEKISLEEILNALSKTVLSPKFQADTQNLIVLIEPADEQRIVLTTNVIRPTIMRLTLKIHWAHVEKKFLELFNAFSGNYYAGPTAGWLFECRVHGLLENGIDALLDKMVSCENIYPGDVYDTYATSEIAHAVCKTMPMKYMPFTRQDRDWKVEVC